MAFLFSLSPIFLIFILVIFFKIDILRLSLISFIYSVLLTMTYFGTPFNVVLLSSFDGILTTLPILLVVYTGILLSSFLIQKGSLQRLTKIFSSGLKNNLQKSLVIGCGFGNFFEGAGVIAEPVVAPMLYSSGIAPEGSVILSILGYSGLMHLALAGVIVTVLSAVTGISYEILSIDLINLSIPATIFLFLSIPYVIGQPDIMIKNFPLILVSAFVVILFAFLTVKFVSYSVSGMIGGLGGLIFLFTLFKIRPLFTKDNFKDILPFVAIFIFLSSVNLIPYLKNLTFNKLVFKITLIPLHTIKITPFYSAYVYLFICFLLSFYLFGDKEDKLVDYLYASIKKGYNPVMSMALFGAMGSVIAFSGMDGSLQSINNLNNIAYCLADGFASYTGKLYPIFAPLLGWIGTFLTGYGVASILLFGKLQLQTADILNISGSFLASSLTVGASIGSISSPFKVALAVPLCNAMGKESKILNKTIPIGIIASLFVGVYTYFMI